MMEGLIPELFDSILGLLELADLYQLRLASRRLEQRSRGAFGAAAFSSLTTDFSRNSLARLSSIAATELRSSVRSLRVSFVGGEDARQKRGYDGPYGHDGYWPRLESGAVDQDSELAGAFVAAVSSFPNCAGVTVTDDHVRQANDFRAKGPEGSLSSADAVELALRAYASPKSPPLRSLHVRMLRDIDWWPPGAITGAAVASARPTLAAHLLDLVLQFNTKTDEHLTYMLDLLTASSHVRNLRVMFCGLGSREEEIAKGYRLGQRLEDPPGFAPPLEHLTLGEIALREADLLRLLLRCGETLETLAFYRMGLGTGSWMGVLQNLHNGPFTRPRRISMQACRDGHFATLAFCPLWKAQRELPESCNGAFKFRYGRTARGPGGLHIVGVLLESEDRAPDMKPSLRALMEYSHRASDEKGVTPMCEHMREVLKVPRIEAYSVRDDPCGKWTGLSPDHQSAFLNM